jgi:hypothetical protein
VSISEGELETTLEPTYMPFPESDKWLPPFKEGPSWPLLFASLVLKGKECIEYLSTVY